MRIPSLRRVLSVLGGVLLLGLAAVVIYVAISWQADRPVEALLPRYATGASRMVPLAGMQVHLRDEGPRSDSGPQPVVLIHGTSASLHTWEGWVRDLSRDRRVISMDLPGFGLTGPAPDGDYSIEAYVRFIAALLDSLSVRTCVLAGNSLGGEIAWEVAHAFPDRVSALILVDAAGYPRQAISVPLGFRIASMPGVRRLAERVLPRSLVARSVRNVYGDPTKVTEPVIDRYFDLLLRAGNRGALSRRLAIAGTGAHSARITGLRQPTLILWGGRDQLIPPVNAERFLRDIPGSKLALFRELGHVPQEEDPERTVAAVRRFLNH
jgi:pimeloyl-ACP methyl ester carboxylesterase